MNKQKRACKFLLLCVINLPDFVLAAPVDTTLTDYAAKGIRLSAFEIRPTLEIGSDWNSNIYNRPTNTQNDFITHVKPAVSVYSNWNRHFLGLDVMSDIQNYVSHPHEDRQIVNVRLNGKLDVAQDSFAYTKFFYLNAPEQRGAPDSPVNALTPTGSQTVSGEVGYDYKKYRINLHLDNTTASMMFANGITGAGTLIPNAQNRNRLGNISTIRVGYEIRPGYEAFIKGSYNFINYGYYNQQGHLRSSDGYKVVAGLALELTGKLTGDARIGYQGSNYVDSYYHGVSGVAGGVTMRWTPTGLTKVTGDITRTINETTQVGYSSYFSTAFTTMVEHELLRNVILNLNLGYIMNNYQSGIIPSSQRRNENNYMAGFNAKYLINRYFFLKSGVNYINRNVTNVANVNYQASDIYFAVGSQY